MPEFVSYIDLGPDDQPLISEKAQAVMQLAGELMDELAALDCNYFEVRRHLLDVRIWNRKPKEADIELFTVPAAE